MHDRRDVVLSAAYGSGALPAGRHGNGYGYGRPLIIRLARDIGVRGRPSGGKPISVFVPVRAAGPAHRAHRRL